ncbi:hypothetical protein BUE63_02425 [Bacillus sp. MB353a]|uniref:hypothetical protein n=1 Tax=Bacillus sp. MB353a TaxID=1982041 RepID=UPI000B536154|nr:hypothetical protein [Bacillus sp. MB353a]OWW11705.1 hypothetical protein BUE63_02425 [Bacillus sp. MB353a]
MSWTDAFIDSLKDWDVLCTVKNIKLKDVLGQIGYRIGQQGLVDNSTIEGLEDRINFLVSEERMDERFLIESLINQVTVILNSMLSELGENIIQAEKMKENFEGQDSLKDIYDRKLAEFKNPSYTYNARHQIDTWEFVINKKFSSTIKKQFEIEDFMKASERVKKDFAKIPQEDLNLSFGELHKKLNK